MIVDVEEELVDATNARENEEEQEQEEGEGGGGGGQLPKDDDLTTDGTTIQSKATVDTKQSNIKSRKKKCLEKKGRI